MDHSERINELRSTLEEVNAQLLDISMSILSEAIESGQTLRPAREKHIAQARRAVDRALDALGHLNSD